MSSVFAFVFVCCILTFVFEFCVFSSSWSFSLSFVSQSCLCLWQQSRLLLVCCNFSTALCCGNNICIEISDHICRQIFVFVFVKTCNPTIRLPYLDQAKRRSIARRPFETLKEVLRERESAHIIKGSPLRGLRESKRERERERG